MNIHAVDLNLFVVFRAVYRTGSVTLAGEQLHMTQSTVSNALKRLRDSFDDPLFVRTHTGMTPTPLAIQLIEHVEGGLTSFDHAIDQARTFAPAESDRLFRIAINDVGQLVLIPTLIAEVRQIAPNVRLETVDASSGLAAKQLLLEGAIDLAIGSWVQMGNGFYQQKLFDETYVAVLARGHELKDEELTLAQYLAAEHVAYRPSGASDDALQTKLGEHGVLGQRKVILTVAHSLGLSAIVAASRLLSTVPARLGDAMARSQPDLRIARLPFEVGPFPIRQQWHERFHADKGGRWLRELTYGVFRNLPLPLVVG